MMVSDKHGLKDRLAGSLKEIQGKITKDKPKEVEGKLQKPRGTVPDTAQDINDDLDKKK